MASRHRRWAGPRRRGVPRACDLRGRKKQDVLRARDLRRRGQPDPGRGREDRRGEGGHGGLGHADGAGEGGRRPEHQQPRLRGLPHGRQLHDPPAGADRREVRRLRAHAAARGRHAAAPAAAEDPSRRRLGPAPAAGHEHPQPGRRRPARRHQPTARTPAPDDHPQRTRRGARRARQRPQRGHPPRQSGAAGIRQGPENPRRREQGAGETVRRLGHRTRAAGARARTRRQLHRPEQHRRAGLGENARLAAAQPRTVPAVPRTALASDGTAPAVRRSDDPDVHRAEKGGTGDQPRLPGNPRLLAQPGALHQGPRRPREGVGPGARRHPAAAQAARTVRERGEAVLDQLRVAAHQLAGHGRARAPDGLHLPRHERLQRLRRARPLPAHRGGRHDLRHLFAGAERRLQPQTRLLLRDREQRVGRAEGEQRADPAQR